ncbi:MAG: phosphodiester glycosidase family protein [Pseudonocardiaceae bacterium]
MGRLTRAVQVAVLTALLGGLVAAPAWSQPSVVPGARPQVLTTLAPGERVAPGVTHRTFSTTVATGRLTGDVVEVDLAAAGVRTGLLTPGAVAARSTVTRMVRDGGAVAGINGDFFDIGRTSAPAGPEVADGVALKAAVPQGRRAAPAVPGAEMSYVFRVGADRRAAIDRLTLDAKATSKHGTVQVVALNQYAIPVNGVGLFTSAWGAASRAGSVCGSDTDAKAGCAPDVTEVTVRNGVVTAVSHHAGAGQLGVGEVVLLGRDLGSTALRSLQVGDAVQVTDRLVAQSGVAPQFAVGGSPILRDGAPTERLDDHNRAARSGAAVSADGRWMYLVTVGARPSALGGVTQAANSTETKGATLAEFSAVLHELGGDDGVNLDGGGSSTLVYDNALHKQVTVVSNPSASARMVPNGIGVFTG